MVTLLDIKWSMALRSNHYYILEAHELNAELTNALAFDNVRPGSRDPFKRDTAYPGNLGNRSNTQGTYRVFSQ